MYFMCLFKDKYNQLLPPKGQYQFVFVGFIFVRRGGSDW